MDHIKILQAYQNTKRLSKVKKVKCLEDSSGKTKITDELKDFIDG